MKKETLELFPIPVTKMNVGKKFLKEFELLKNEQEVTSHKENGQVHHFSDDNYVLNQPRFSKLKNFVVDQTQQFMQNMMNVDAECALTQSWVNWNYPNEHTQTHIHPNSIASGVLYLEATSQNNVIFFHKNYSQTTRNFLDPKTFSHPNPNGEKKFYETSYPINLTNGDFIIFPSYLPHSVPRNMTSEKRISLAYNSVTKHRIGSNKRLTEIDYKILIENS
jgi:uncharacterized protein (TIGR02466 family)